MTSFIGEYKARMDDRGRLVFPAAFKAVLGEGADYRFVVKKSLFANCLEMYTYEQWVKDSEAVKSRLNFFNREHAALWREYMRGTALVEADGKLGRITIPKELLASAGIGKEVLFSGSSHIIEIWDKEAYGQCSLSSDEYTSLAEKILG
ncbi:MAG: hypothetical protein KBT00_00140 [Bacteroidales bacterium]|nr:hypothetical protein [Candidatus Cacconaster merdequi]